MTESRVAEIMALADALAKAAYGAGRFPCATNDAVVEERRARLESALREPVEMSEPNSQAVSCEAKFSQATKSTAPLMQGSVGASACGCSFSETWGPDGIERTEHRCDAHLAAAGGRK